MAGREVDNVLSELDEESLSKKFEALSRSLREEGEVDDTFAELEEECSVAEFDKTILNPHWPVQIPEMPCPECEAMFMTGEEMVAHCVEVHRWEERNRNIFARLMLTHVPEAQALLKKIWEEACKNSEAGASDSMESKGEVCPEAEKLESVPK